MTSAGPCSGPVALQSLALLRGRLGWSALLLRSVGLLVLLSEEAKINGLVYFCLCTDPGN